MKYQVRITGPAEDELEAIFLWIRASSAPNADRWLLGFYELAKRLEIFPERGRIASEATFFPDLQIRQVMHHRHRVIYQIDKSIIRIIGVRHGHRRPLRSGELRKRISDD